MGDLFGGPPNARHLALYSRWASCGWGIVMTGNVQVDASHLSLGRDMVVPKVLSASNVEPFARLAAAIHGTSTSREDERRPLALMQLSHTGRQAPNFIGGRWPFVPPMAPSAVALDFSQRPSRAEEGTIGRVLSGHLSWAMHRLMFQAPRAMTTPDIESVVGAFVRGAQLAARSGFDGVELHAGHGCEFLFPSTSSRSNGRSQ